MPCVMQMNLKEQQPVSHFHFQPLGENPSPLPANLLRQQGCVKVCYVVPQIAYSLYEAPLQCKHKRQNESKTKKENF